MAQGGPNSPYLIENKGKKFLLADSTDCGTFLLRLLLLYRLWVLEAVARFKLAAIFFDPTTNEFS
jgi:hypothetical protein